MTPNRNKHQENSTIYYLSSMYPPKRVTSNNIDFSIISE